ncbi:MAG: hypothetical protein WAT39_11755 [Planctomycetota bacterium]
MNGERPGRRRLLWAWLATFFAFAAVAHGNFETDDAGFTLLAATNLYQRGDTGIRRADQGAATPREDVAARAIAAGISGKVGQDGVAYTWFPIGHVALMVPFVAVGSALDHALPGIDAGFRQGIAPGRPAAQAEHTLEYERGAPVITQGLIASIVPPACAASILILLLLLARRLGAAERDAWIGASAILLATQCFAFGRETLSDGPGLAFLLATVLAVANVHAGGGARTALAGGLCGGAAVLLRYQNAALLVPVGLLLLLGCRRPWRWRPVVAFAAGVLPAAGLLLAVNHARFGNAFDTGYPRVDAWIDQPIWLGATKMLFGAGRGMAWVSPLVWLALPLALQWRQPIRWRWLAWLALLFPLLFFGGARGWQGGECWGSRYATHGLVLLLAIVLPQTLPWRRWPKAWWALVACGAFACLTSVVAPTRGVVQLANQAAWSSGIVAEPEDAADPVSWQVRFTPLLANWRYAFASLRGEFEDATARPHHDGRAIAAVFAASPQTERQRNSPVRWEDRGCRHLACRFWGAILGASWWVLLLVPLALATFCARRARGGPAPSESSTAR